MSFHANAIDVELCPKCHSCMPLRSYSLPFAATANRGYINPSQSDVSTIERLLTAPIMQIYELAAEIKRLEALLATLKRHRTDLETHVQRSHVYVKPAPIRELPTEILDLVFSAACTSFEPADYKTPLNISLVCSKWRDMALSHPALWTHIYVGSSLHARDMFDYYLQRCGKLPISMKIDQPLPANHFDLMFAVSRTCEQWQVLEIHVGEHDFDTLMGSQGFGFPELESLTLAPKGKASFLVFPETLSWAHARFLSTLVLLDSSANSDSLLSWEDCLLPDVGLLTFRTDRRDLSDLPVPYFSSDAADTTTLVVCGVDHFVPADVELEPLYITNLILEPAPGDWTSGLTSLLQEATIPYLDTLTIICPASHISLKNLCDLLRAVPTLLKNSECACISFSCIMNSTGYSDGQIGAVTQPSIAETLLEVFEYMPLLESLRIVESVSGPAILTEQFIEGISGRALLPRLTSLELVWAESHVPTENVISMLDSRVDEEGIDGEENAKLASVVLGVRNGGELPRAVLDHMKDLRRDGIRASVW